MELIIKEKHHNFIQRAKKKQNMQFDAIADMYMAKA